MGSVGTAVSRQEGEVGPPGGGAKAKNSLLDTVSGRCLWDARDRIWGGSGVLGGPGQW